jgi:hypothetical protein
MYITDRDFVATSITASCAALYMSFIHNYLCDGSQKRPETNQSNGSLTERCWAGILHGPAGSYINTPVSG